MKRQQFIDKCERFYDVNKKLPQHNATLLEIINARANARQSSLAATTCKSAFGTEYSFPTGEWNMVGKPDRFLA